jgi:diphthamide biosynthesis methyltransferase
MLYLVGLGLADEKDITVKGLEIVRKAERVYLEAYTAVLLVEKDVLVSRSESSLDFKRSMTDRHLLGSRKPSMAVL